MARFNTSRPTMQQAARILGHERLMIMRRGVRGGAYSIRPTIETVVHAVSIYLRAEGTSLRDIIEPTPALGQDAVRHACECLDEDLRNELKAFVRRELKKKMMITAGDHHNAVEGQFEKILGRLCGNAAIRLIFAVFYELGARNFNRVLQRTDSRMLENRRTLIDLSNAILARDVSRALAYWDEYVGNAIKWQEQDLGEKLLNQSL